MHPGQGTPARERRRWEHEHVLDEVQQRLDEHPEKMRQRRETVEHPFGTIKCWMGYTHFQMKTLKRVATEMALYVLAYNLKRVINIMGVQRLIQAIQPAYALVYLNLCSCPAGSAHKLPRSAQNRATGDKILKTGKPTKNSHHSPQNYNTEKSESVFTQPGSTGAEMTIASYDRFWGQSGPQFSLNDG